MTANTLVIGKPLKQLPAAFLKMAPRQTRVAIVADAGVPHGYTTALLKGLKAKGLNAMSLSLPSGERSKTLTQAGVVYRQLARWRFERTSWLMALGGGVVGDLTGFIAATYMRGIPFIQIPTTLLAQVDASIGGKTGVDIPEGKNLVGAFYSPKLVWIDPSLMESLPARHWRNGAGEVIKYGAILDAGLFSRLEKNMGRLVQGWTPDWTPLISRCAGLKEGVTRKDPYETHGLRAILNFGHTVGHAIEAAGEYRDYLHGEAIAIGMIAAGYLSRAVMGFSEKDQARLKAVIINAGLPIRVKKPIARSVLMTYLARDKKVTQGTVRFVLLKKMGHAVSGIPVSANHLNAALRLIGL